MIPEWCKKAAIELRFPPEKWAEQPRLSTSEQKWIDEDAAIIAKHAPDYGELVEAAREAESRIKCICGPYDLKPCIGCRAEVRLRRALEPFK